MGHPIVLAVEDSHVPIAVSHPEHTETVFVDPDRQSSVIENNFLSDLACVWIEEIKASAHTDPEHTASILFKALHLFLGQAPRIVRIMPVVNTLPVAGFSPYNPSLVGSHSIPE